MKMSGASQISTMRSNRTFRCVATGLMILVFAALSAAAETQPARRPPAQRAPDPALLPIEDVPGLPRVLLIGDSISIGYTLQVRELLKGKANVHHPPVNCGDTQRGLASLDGWLGEKKWDVIHFNFGLHDLKYLNGKGEYVTPDLGKQVAPLPQYERNLRQLAQRLKKTGARIVWCSTTPVPEGARGRVKDAELEYNAVAAKVAAESGIAIDDLHAVAKARQAEIQRPHDVHFTPEGCKLLAQAVVVSVEQALAVAPRR
jgi:acyl-CoA thioesterase-1